MFFSPSTSTVCVGQGPREQADSLVHDTHTRRMLKIAALHPPGTLSGVQPCIFRNLGHVTELPGEIHRLTRGLFNGRLRHEPGYSTTSFYSLMNSSKRSEPATSATDVLAECHADNHIHEKPHLVATSVPSDNKENPKFLLVGGYCSLCQLNLCLLRSDASLQ